MGLSPHPALGGTVANVLSAAEWLQQRSGMLVAPCVPCLAYPPTPLCMHCLHGCPCWHVTGDPSRPAQHSVQQRRPRLAMQMANWGNQEQPVQLLLEGAEAWGSVNVTTLASPHRLDTNSLDEPHKVTQQLCKPQIRHGACWSSSPCIGRPLCAAAATWRHSDVEPAGLHSLCLLKTPSVRRWWSHSCRHADVPPCPGTRSIACLAAPRRTRTLPVCTSEAAGISSERLWSGQVAPVTRNMPLAQLTDLRLPAASLTIITLQTTLT